VVSVEGKMASASLDLIRDGSVLVVPGGWWFRLLTQVWSMTR